jgi:hypothetical protein
VQLVKKLLHALVLAGLAAGAAFGQQPPAKTTDQQARSYILSAFITGAAPTILSEGVELAPGLREQLQLPEGADFREVYDAIAFYTAGPPERLRVRGPSGEEIIKAKARQDVGQPLFAMDIADSTFILQYDLERNRVVYVAQVAEPPPPRAQRRPEPKPEPEAPVVSAAPPPAPPVPIVLPEPAPAPVPVPVAKPEPPPPPPPAPIAKPEPPPPPPAPQQRVFDVVEPKVPGAAPKPPPAPVVEVKAARPAAKPATAALRRTGPCEVKPVMSDQDLANCGGTPSSAGGPTLVEPKAPMASPRQAAPAPAADTAAKVQPAALKRTGPCMVKPVMSDQDLLNCGSAPR